MATTINKIISFSIFAALVVTSFLIIKPFIPAMFTALLLSFIFRPLYTWINKKVNKPTIIAMLVSVIVVAVLVVLVIITLQVTIKQVMDFYTFTQASDILAPIKVLVAKVSNIDPNQLSFLFDMALEKMTSLVVNSVNSVILNLPFLVLQLVVTFFVMFFFIRDGDIMIEYLKSVLPFDDATKNKLIQRFKDITYGVIYGSIIVGLIQGISAGIGFYIFGVEGAFVLTLMCIVLAILPLGCWIVWIPASLTLLAAGKTGAGIGLLLYGIIVVSYIDNIIRPYFVSKKTALSPMTAVLGMLGGVYLLGIIGLFVGPIILDYLIIFVEFYKKGAYDV